MAGKAALTLPEAARTLSEQGFEVEAQIAWSAHPGQAIVDAAEQTGADLIAIATRGRGRLGRRIFGSVTPTVIAR